VFFGSKISMCSLCIFCFFVETFCFSMCFKHICNCSLQHFYDGHLKFLIR
jgi:hypothetical protein